MTDTIATAPAAKALADALKSADTLPDVGCPTRGMPPSSVASVDGGWGTPIPLGAGARHPIPLDGLPSWLRQFTENAAEAIQAPTDLVLMQALSAMSVTVANKARVEVRAGQLEPLNLYTCVVLEPGTRKSPVVKLCSRPIWAWERERRWASSLNGAGPGMPW